MDEDAAAAARREARKDWPTKLVRLGEEDDAGELPGSTLAERLELLWQLAQAAYPQTEEELERGSPRRVARLVRRKLHKACEGGLSDT